MITPLHSKIIMLSNSECGKSNVGEHFFGDRIKHLKLENPDNVAISYLNINSIRNKFENFTGIVQNNLDVLVIAETKLDKTFPTSQFCIPGFKQPYRLDISGNSGGLLIYINEQIPSKQSALITILSILRIHYLLSPM